jgi:hypothetical protein
MFTKKYSALTKGAYYFWRGNHTTVVLRAAYAFPQKRNTPGGFISPMAQAQPQILLDSANAKPQKAELGKDQGRTDAHLPTLPVQNQSRRLQTHGR